MSGQLKNAHYFYGNSAPRYRLVIFFFFFFSLFLSFFLSIILTRGQYGDKGIQPKTSAKTGAESEG
jgi:hypothetical protein